MTHRAVISFTSDRKGGQHMAGYGTGSNVERALARSKSFTGKAVATLVLYIVLWFPGLVANVLFLNEAKRTQEIAGQSLPGVGCLTWLLWLNLWGCILAIGLIAACLAAVGSHSG